MRKLINFFAFCFFGFVFISCGLTEPDEQKSFLTVTIGTDFISKLYSSETRGIGAENATAPLSYKAELTAMASDYMWTTSSALTASKSANLIVPSIPANSSVSLTVKVMDSEGDVVYQGSTAVNAGVGQSLALNMNLSYAKDSALDFSLDTSSYYQIFGYYEDEEPVDFSSIQNYWNVDNLEIPLKNKNIVFVFGQSAEMPSSATYYIWKLNGVELESHENPLVINLAKEADMANAKTPSLTCQPVYEYEENGEVKTNYGDSASYQYFRNFKFPDTDTETLPLKEMAFYESLGVGNFWYDFNEDRSFCSEIDNVYICGAAQKVYTYEENDSKFYIKEIRKDSFGRLVTVDVGTISGATDYSMDYIAFDTATNKLWVFLTKDDEENCLTYNSEYSAGSYSTFESFSRCPPKYSSCIAVYNNYIFYACGYSEASATPGTFGIINGNMSIGGVDTSLLNYDESYSFIEEFPEGKSCAHVTGMQSATINGIPYMYVLISDSYGLCTSGIYHERGGVARLKIVNKEGVDCWEFDKDFGIKGLSDNVEVWGAINNSSGEYFEFKASVPPYKNDSEYFYNPLSFCAIKDDYLVILDDGHFKVEDSDPGEFSNRDRIMLFNLKTNSISVQKEIVGKTPYISGINYTVLR